MLFIKEPGKYKHINQDIKMMVEERQLSTSVRFFKEHKKLGYQLLFRVDVFEQDFESVNEQMSKVFNSKHIDFLRLQENLRSSYAEDFSYFANLWKFENFQLKTFFRKNGRASTIRHVVKNKLHHDDDVPSYQSWDDQGNLGTTFYYKRGKKHRDPNAGPADIKNFYYKNEIYSRIEEFIDTGSMKLVKTYGAPAGPNGRKKLFLTKEEFFQSFDRKIVAKYNNLPSGYYGSNKLPKDEITVPHNETGPAIIHYDENGKKEHFFYAMYGKHFEIDFEIPPEHLKTYFENLQIIQ